MEMMQSHLVIGYEAIGEPLFVFILDLATCESAPVWAKMNRARECIFCMSSH